MAQILLAEAPSLILSHFAADTKLSTHFEDLSSTRLLPLHLSTQAALDPDVASSARATQRQFASVATSYLSY